MRVKLRDFAELNRISERTVQIHIKNNLDVLQEHIERKGKQGTWLDDFAQEFLIEKIQLPSQEELYIPSAREAALMTQLNEAYRELSLAERRASEHAGAAALLEAETARAKELENKVGALTHENGVLSADRDEWKNKAAKLEETAQRASGELTETRKQFENEKRLLQQEIEQLRKRKWYQLLFQRNGK